MKHNLRLPLFILLTIFSCSQAQDRIKQKPLTGDVKEDILILLPEGEFQVDIMDKVEMNPKTQVLMQKFQTAVQKDPEWFVEHQQKMKPGEPLPYDKRMGLTKAEYDEFINMSKNPNSMRIAKSGSETIKIKYILGKLTFEASGKAKVLDELTINLQDMSVHLGEVKLSKPEEVNVTTADNGLKSRWKGFTWRYEQANKKLEELKTIADYQDLQAKIYKVTIGQLEATGQTYMEIKVSEVENGQKTVNFQMPFIIQ